MREERLALLLTGPHSWHDHCQTNQSPYPHSRLLPGGGPRLGTILCQIINYISFSPISIILLLSWHSMTSLIRPSLWRRQVCPVQGTSAFSCDRAGLGEPGSDLLRHWEPHTNHRLVQERTEDCRVRCKARADCDCPAASQLVLFRRPREVSGRAWPSWC